MIPNQSKENQNQDEPKQENRPSTYGKKEIPFFPWWYTSIKWGIPLIYSGIITCIIGMFLLGMIAPPAAVPSLAWLAALFAAMEGLTKLILVTSVLFGAFLSALTVASIIVRGAFLFQDNEDGKVLAISLGQDLQEASKDNIALVNIKNRISEEKATITGTVELVKYQLQSAEQRIQLYEDELFPELDKLKDLVINGPNESNAPVNARRGKMSPFSIRREERQKFSAYEKNGLNDSSQQQGFTPYFRASNETLNLNESLNQTSVLNFTKDNNSNNIHPTTSAFPNLSNNNANNIPSAPRDSNNVTTTNVPSQPIQQNSGGDETIKKNKNKV